MWVTALQHKIMYGLLYLMQPVRLPGDSLWKKQKILQKFQFCFVLYLPHRVISGRLFRKFSTPAHSHTHHVTIWTPELPACDETVIFVCELVDLTICCTGELATGYYIGFASNQDCTWRPKNLFVCVCVFTNLAYLINVGYTCDQIWSCKQLLSLTRRNSRSAYSVIELSEGVHVAMFLDISGTAYCTSFSIAILYFDFQTAKVEKVWGKCVKGSIIES